MALKFTDHGAAFSSRSGCQRGKNQEKPGFDLIPTSELAAQIRESRLAKEIETVVKGFDWHSQVTVSFLQGDGGAAWSRSKRTITVYDEYVQRFINQGKKSKSRKK